MAASAWGVDHGIVSKTYMGGGRFASITQNPKALKGARDAVEIGRRRSSMFVKGRPDFGYRKDTSVGRMGQMIADLERPTKIKKSSPDGMDMMTKGGKKGKKVRLCLKPVSVTGQ